MKVTALTKNKGKQEWTILLRQLKGMDEHEAVVMVYQGILRCMVILEIV